MSTRLFEGVDHASLYAKYRPTYPQQLIDRITTFMTVKCNLRKDFEGAVDVGCGTGQLTRDLASHFKQVIGVDVSEAQLQFARESTTNINITYSVGGGESIPIESSSVDLVTCAQAAHWMDFSKFCDEVDRVLKPCGCLAVIGYSSPNIIYQGSSHDGLNRLFMEFKKDTFTPYRAKQIDHLDNRYRDLKMPYDINERDDSLSIKRDMTLTDFLNVVSSWSHYQRLIRDNPDRPDPLQELKLTMMTELGKEASADEIELTIEESIFMLLAAKPHHD